MKHCLQRGWEKNVDLWSELGIQLGRQELCSAALWGCLGKVTLHPQCFNASFLPNEDYIKNLELLLEDPYSS